MYIGDTYTEKKQSMDELCRRARKWGITAAILYGIIAFLMLFTGANGGFTKFIVSIIFFLGSTACAFFYGYFWYFGLITVRSWFVKRDISSGDVAVTAGGITAITYLLGGRKAVRVSSVIMIIILIIALLIGFWAGALNYFKIKREIAKAYV